METASSLPRATDAAALRRDPIAYLCEARDRLGDMFVIREGGPIFSRTADCPVVIVALGAGHQRRVLCDSEHLSMPPSAAEMLGLPAPLGNLNRGLHSMAGDEHRQQKQALSALLRGAPALVRRAELGDKVAQMTAGWDPARPQPMLATMRGLLEKVAATLIFGPESGHSPGLAETLSSYFRHRRSASSPLTGGAVPDHERLVATGGELDRLLREEARRARSAPAGSYLLADIAGRGRSGGGAFSEDALVAHANILFVSATEPVAVALTWLLLVLSQLPEQRRELRRMARSDSIAGGRPGGLIQETLRLLTPNAIMVRSAARAFDWDGLRIPRGAEIVLAPVVAHRDARIFPSPDRFDPDRWIRARPTPFEYFPFGGGVHDCIGKGLAMVIIRTVLLNLTARYDLVLASDDPVDWDIDIMLKPKSEIFFRPYPAGATGTSAGLEWTGPSRGLLTLPASLR